MRRLIIILFSIVIPIALSSCDDTKSGENETESNHLTSCFDVISTEFADENSLGITLLDYPESVEGTPGSVACDLGFPGRLAFTLGGIEASPSAGYVDFCEFKDDFLNGISGALGEPGAGLTFEGDCVETSNAGSTSFELDGELGLWATGEPFLPVAEVRAIYAYSSNEDYVIFINEFQRAGAIQPLPLSMNELDLIADEINSNL